VQGWARVVYFKPVIQSDFLACPGKARSPLGPALNRSGRPFWQL